MKQQQNLYIWSYNFLIDFVERIISVVASLYSIKYLIHKRCDSLNNKDENTNRYAARGKWEREREREIINKWNWNRYTPLCEVKQAK